MRAGLAGILIVLLLATLGAAVGASLNRLAFLFCDDYWSLVLRRGTAGDPTLAVIQGSLEGGIAGGIFGLIVVAVIIGFTADVFVTLGMMMRRLGQLVGIVFLGWLLLGLVACGAYAVLPGPYQLLFPRTLSSHSPVGFAFVGGAIWGAYAAAGFAVILLSIRVGRDVAALEARPGGFDVV